ncbi:transposase IS116/IS110/IS902 family protein (plasmid) [Pseudonocardia dioxanivorans CB1190]|uniref:Transposase IS116/IS110/IS902 family protein n=1 Tax=Pseudonocardia dioxanivorans (strain ATCC 55486 / DSM 44775 / JCM 13855 / CB1190) TaxID=675635 RepID=F2L771_PSEUX|nr:IS110 family transposase [Pseudonocardia dioxanivorans]AEA29044.1 transposase IS116/IS110/IS902 family protein [Pseudonocardia dioxanivorans CB1190]
MLSTPSPHEVVGGVDTHRDTHHAAVIDAVGRRLDDAQFPATARGYEQLLTWMRSHGELTRVGVEGTGSYGAGLARFLAKAHVWVVEVDRPDRRARRRHGKSDPLDAYAAANAALSGSASGTPKSRVGLVEAIRSLRVARRGAVKARTQAINQLRAQIVTAPAELREQLRGLTTGALVKTCARLRPAAQGAELVALDPDAIVSAATKTALRQLARRHQHLSEEIRDLDRDLQPLVQAAAPELVALSGVGPEVAGQLLACVGDNVERLRSEAAFAHLCGVAPIPASSGRTDRHRLNRGGDRSANNALHTIVLSRMRYDPRTRDYVLRRRAQSLRTKEIMRCLKRYVAREVYRALPRDLALLDSP